MSVTITTQPLTTAAFAAFGDVLEIKNHPDMLINQGMCGRHNDLAQLDFSQGRAGISLFDATPRDLPYQLEMVERHPKGSQAFIPMTPAPFLVIVAPDNNGRPATPLAFLTAPGQAINLHKSIWHGVLTPLSSPGLFAVVDRISPNADTDTETADTGDNLEEFWFDTPFTIVCA